MENSNNNVDWAKHYDFYETEFRNMYKTVAKMQNDSHWLMLQKYFKKKIKNGGVVFGEIGFGAGLTLRKASKFFKQVYGLDISPKNIELTKNELLEEGYKNVNLLTTDILKRNENLKAKFDVISFIHGIEHFSNSDFPILFDNIKYYLKPNGVFTGALPNNLQFNFRMCPNCNQVFEIDGHLSRHTLDSLKTLFEQNNFQVLHLSNMNWYWYLNNKGWFLSFYQFIKQKVFCKTSRMQIEFIIKPIN